VNEDEALLALRGNDPDAAADAEAALWEMWCRSDIPDVDSWMREGVEALERHDLAEAEGLFTRIIEGHAEFAEGWNKRATLYYLVGEYVKSLADCDEVLKRNPSHFGALSGYGQIYLKLDQPEKALDYFERALAVNPNMEQVQAVIGELRALVREKRKRSI
jgi:tetratricopeptide (TPR) repeat protein